MTLVRTLLLMVLVTLPAVLPAAQPKIRSAREHLNTALRHVLKSASETPKQHLNSATTALQMAQSNLENAAKNKGSHSHVAIEKIQAALKEVEATRLNASSRDKAVAQIKSALAEVDEAARAGRR